MHACMHTYDTIRYVTLRYITLHTMYIYIWFDYTHISIYIYVYTIYCIAFCKLAKNTFRLEWSPSPPRHATGFRNRISIACLQWCSGLWLDRVGGREKTNLLAFARRSPPSDWALFAHNIVHFWSCQSVTTTHLTLESFTIILGLQDFHSSHLSKKVVTSKVWVAPAIHLSTVQDMFKTFCNAFLRIVWLGFTLIGYENPLKPGSITPCNSLEINPFKILINPYNII